MRDLGLVAAGDEIWIANPIYAEAVSRELTCASQVDMLVKPARHIEDDGSLNADKLLEAFQAYCRGNSEHRLQHFQYRQAEPQLLLQAFLQRVLKGGAHLERDCGLGFQLVDLLIPWPRPQGMQRIAIECKILRGGLQETLAKGLPHTAGYVDRSCPDAGHLVVFDRSEKPWREKMFHRSEEFDGTPVEVRGM